jgi:MscS family membrane protein
MISDRPVLGGDLCRFGDRTGTVEDIGLRSTRIRTPDRTLVTVPNAQFSSMVLENISRRDKTWFHPRLSLSRETSPAQIRQLLDSISRLIEWDPSIDSGNCTVRFAAVARIRWMLTSQLVFLRLTTTNLAGCNKNFCCAFWTPLNLPGRA